jgi:hypothetical protein
LRVISCRACANVAVAARRLCTATGFSPNPTSTGSGYHPRFMRSRTTQALLQNLRLRLLIDGEKRSWPPCASSLTRKISEAETPLLTAGRSLASLQRVGFRTSRRPTGVSYPVSRAASVKSRQFLRAAKAWDGASASVSGSARPSGREDVKFVRARWEQSAPRAHRQPRRGGYPQVIHRLPDRIAAHEVMGKTPFLALTSMRHSLRASLGRYTICS